MTDIAARDLTEEAAYKLLVGCIVPRPIAWITTRSVQGHTNLAPFSAFTFVSSNPPMIAVSIGRRGDERKDTAINILREREFVVNIGNMASIEPLHQSSFEYPGNISEINELGLSTLPSRDVQPPRLAKAPINLECRLHNMFEFGERATQLFIGEVIRFRVREHLFKDGKIDSYALDPIARLAGPNYAALGTQATFGLHGSLTVDQAK